MRFTGLSSSAGHVKIGWHHDAMAPGFAPAPARTRQVIRRGGKDVGYRGPDVAPSITIVIDSVLHKTGRHELVLSHGTSPRPRHGRRTHMASIDDFERLQQF